MKYLLMGAVIINSIIGSYNVIFADMSWGIFNFAVTSLCVYSYLQLED
tara:strand:- start:1483 stop:1626 length:144 start_codon:yes stop_codon:yes gene_type:complete